MDQPSTDEWEAAFAVILEDGPLDDPWSDDDDLLPAATRLSAVPGVELASALARLSPRRLAPPDAIAYARATERMIAWLHLRQAEALVAVAGPRPQIDTYAVDDATITIEDAARSEVAAALRWTESTTHDRITTARLLCGPMLLTNSALKAGEITYRHAEAVSATMQRISSFTDWLAPDGDDRAFARSCRSLEEDVLPVARHRDVAATRRRAERSLLRLDAAHAEQRRRRAMQQRDVWVSTEPDGMALLCARLGIAQAHACLSALDGIARNPDQFDREAHPSIGERRADALTSALLASVTGSDGVTAGSGSPVRAHVDVVIDLPTLIGLDERPATLRGTGPGGPVPVAAQVVRELIESDPSATMRRLVTDPLTGHLLDRGRSTYAIPPALRSFIHLRDGTCRFPGCHRRADLGQVDHAQPWREDGRTDRDNLGVLCIRHHHLKTFAGWTITRSGADGSATWRSPAGIEYEHPPPGLLSDG